MIKGGKGFKKIKTRGDKRSKETKASCHRIRNRDIGQKIKEKSLLSLGHIVKGEGDHITKRVRGLK